MPFITEEIAGSFRKYTEETQEFLLNQSYPSPDKSLINEAAEKQMAILQGITGEIRTIRAQFNVPPGLKIKASLFTADAQERAVIEKYRAYIEALAKIEGLDISSAAFQNAKQSATAVFANTTICVPLEGLIDFEKESQRLAKELAVVETGITNRGRMLSNESFLKNAPAEQVEKAKEELRQMQLKAKSINAAIANLK